MPGSKLESALDAIGEVIADGLMVVEEDESGVYDEKQKNIKIAMLK